VLSCWCWIWYYWGLGLILCVQAWFGWLCSGVAPGALNLGGSGGGVVDLALLVCG
jgi:hypothetical protein